MQVRALRSFRGRLGMVRAGLVLTVEDTYGRALVRQRLAEEVKLAVAAAPVNAAVRRAPETLEPEGNVHARSSAVLREGGEGRPSSARPAGRRSRKKTSTSSGAEHG
jgi:hypothetical protein